MNCGPLPRLHFADARTGYLALINGMIKTTDGGSTWASLAGSPRTTALYFVSSDVGFTVDEGFGPTDAFSTTTDGGHSWVRQEIHVGGLRSMSFQGAQTGWALFGDGQLFKKGD